LKQSEDHQKGVIIVFDAFQLFKFPDTLKHGLWCIFKPEPAMETRSIAPKNLQKPDISAWTRGIKQEPVKFRGIRKYAQRQ